MKKKKRFETGRIVLNYWLEIVMVICSIISIVIDSCYKNKIDSIIVINSDIVMILLPLVVTILSITLSLPREQIYGIENTDFRKLRGDKAYNFHEMLIITIVLFIIFNISSNLGFNILPWTLSTFSVIYSIVFINQEIPILIRNDKKVKSIIKKHIHKNFKIIDFDKQSNEVSMINAVQNLIFTEGIISAYKVLESNDNQQNRIYLDKILDIQNTFLFGYINNHTITIDNVKNQYKNIDIIQAVDTSLKNLKDILSLNMELNILEIYGDEEHFYHITRSMFALHKILSILEINHKLQREFSDLVQLIFMKMKYGKVDDRSIRFYYKILNAMLVNSTSGDELWFLEILRDSSFEGLVSIYGTDEYMVFVSIYLYYLVELEPSTPQLFKDEIVNFIGKPSEGLNSDGASWKSIFNHKLSYLDSSQTSEILPKLLQIYDCNSNRFSWYEPKHSSGRIVSIIDEKSFTKQLLMDWWISYVLSNINHHAYSFNSGEDVQLPSLNEADAHAFSVLLNKKWFKDDKLITKQKLPIFSFYDSREIVEDYMEWNSITKALREYKNKNIKESILNELSANKVNEEKLSEHKQTLSKGFIEAIEKLSIIDKDIDLSEEDKRYFAMSFDSRWSDGLIKSVADRFPESINRLIHDSFKNDPKINDIKKKITSYSIDDLNNIIAFKPTTKNAFIYELNTDLERSKLINEINQINAGEKLWLPHDLYMRNNPIRMNIEYISEDSSLRFFNNEEINTIIDRDFKLVNGLYKYEEGADGEKSILLERDELFKLISDKYFFARIVFKYKIIYSYDDILYYDVSDK